MSHDAAMILHLPTENLDRENSRGRPPKRNEVRVSDRLFSPKNGHNDQSLINSAVIPGQFRGDSAAMSEGFRSDSGTAWERLGEYLADMTTADHERVVINGTCKALIEAIICTQETAQQLRATIIETEGSDDSYPTYLAGLESMLSHFNAGANVKVTDLYEQSAVADTAITKRFQRDKIKPFIEQRGILVKKEDNTFRWATLPELQNLQKMYIGEPQMYVGGTLGKSEGALQKPEGTLGEQKASQTLGQKLGWIRHLRMPRARTELVIGSGIGLAAAWGVLEVWDAVSPALGTFSVPVPEWLQPALTVAGHGVWLGAVAGIYGLQWAIRTNIKRLSAAIGYALVITGSSLPVLEVCGFNGGELGQYLTAMLLMTGMQPSWIAAAGTLLALGASIRMGDPLTRLAGLFDLIGAGVTALLPGGKAAAQEKALPTPVLMDASREAELKAKMQAVLDARKLDYIAVQQVAVGPVLTTFMVKVPLDKDLKPLTREAEKIASVFRSSGSVGITEHVRGTECGAIEVPNAERGVVKLGELMDTESWQTFNEPLPVLLGVDTLGQPKITSLPAMVHLLVAGSTGMGKSIFLNGLLLSMMSKSSPDMLRLHMIDPKMLEFGLYEGSPFVQGEIITDMAKVRPVLEELIEEMERRYALMKSAKVRNIAQYNAKYPDAPLPYHVALFEEFADFVMQDRAMGKMTKIKNEEGEEVEATEAEVLIIRKAQKGRAAGIHVIPTTQRPDKDIVTPLIRSNMPSRISMHVMSEGDSKIVLGYKGAERLLDKGDAYGMFPGCTELQRFHSALVTEREVEAAIAAQRRRWPQ